MKISVGTVIISMTILAALTLLLICITDRYVLTLDFYDNSGDPVAGIASKEKQVLENIQQWIYLCSAVYLMIKTALTALVLYTALYLSGNQVRFTGTLQVAVCAETIFLIAAVAKIIFFHDYFPRGTLADWHKFYILSVLTLWDTAPADWYYALQTLNAFELLYWFALALGIARISGLNYDRSLRIVVCSYVPALVVWIAAVTFFTLVMFPATG